MRISKPLCVGLSVLTLGVLAACGGGSDSTLQVSSGTVLKNVTVVNTRDGALSTGMSVIVDGGKIVQVTNQAVTTSGTAQSVDASGKFVVPGYLDMHAHVVETADLNPTFFPLLIANGVTGFREESDSDANKTRGAKVNADAAAGLLNAPEVIFNGGEAHLSPAVSALTASNNGMPSIDHLGAGWGLLLDCSADEAVIRADSLANGFKPPFPADYVPNPRAYDAAKNAPFYQRIVDTYSEAKCVTLNQAFVKNNTWQTPTLIRLRTQDWGNDALYRADPNLAYVEKTRIAGWNKLGDQFATLPASAVTTLQQFYGLQKKTVKLMQDNGVKIMAGSDVGGVWLIAGFSLLQEFRELADAGLTPLQVLQTTTLNPAQFLKREATMGTVEAGKNADLVLLDANPVASAANLEKISGVMLRGKYFPKTALDKMKSDVATAYAR